MDTSKIKKNVGAFAASLVKNNSVVGLGTGSTTCCFIESLAERVRKEKLSIKTCATSQESEKLAKKLGLSVSSDALEKIDVTFDGADEVDPKKNMIKGAGGALLREKIIASASRKLIILIDETKLVKKLGAALLPVEVIPFGHKITAKEIEALGLRCHQRKKNGKPFITDNGNFIYDIVLNKKHPKLLDERLRKIPGIVETGFFFGLASRVIVGYRDGKIESL